jgi:uncharacterized protein DUF6404
MAIQELERKPISKRNCLPPMHRLQRKMRLRVRPPHYNSFFSNAFWLGLYFGVVWGLTFFGLMSIISDLDVPLALYGSLVAGCGFGLAMGKYYSDTSRKHSLSDWDAL